MTNRQYTRSIQLQGAYNLRDVGGYATPDGKTTKWRTLFRSDQLAKLAKGDLKQIEKLNLKLLIDLRSDEERLPKPNRLPNGHGITVQNIPIYDVRKSHNDLTKEIFYGKLGGMDLKDLVIEAYTKAATDYQKELRLFFELLLNPDNYPALVLCNAGKDRTGVVIALTLLAVGISMKTIVQDYMLSKVCLAPMIRRMTTKVRWMSLFRADCVQLKKLLDTRVDYLMATLNAIDREFDSPESFFDSLGMDQDKRTALRNILCSQSSAS